MFKRTLVAALTLGLLGLTGCQTTPYDYSAIEEERPRSILILPPMNHSVEVNAPYSYLSVLTKPVAEKGYYVFPVSVIDGFLKENGLPTPAEMHAIPLDKIQQHIGADAVLYVTIEDWGQKYLVLSSVTVVKAYVKLVSTKTGNLLWEAATQAERGASSGDNGLVGAIVEAAVNQIAGTLDDQTPEVARLASHQAFNNASRGLPDGPYKLRRE